MLSKVESLNQSFRSIKVLNPGFLCSRSVGSVLTPKDRHHPAIAGSFAPLGYELFLSVFPTPHLSLYGQFLQN